MLITILLGLWLTMALARGTPIGDAMHRVAVEMPARRLSRITRGQVLLTVALAGITLSLIWLLENDGRMLVAMGLPEVTSFAMAIDLASVIDLAVVALFAASSVRIRAVKAALVRRVVVRRFRRRAVRTRRPNRPANDEDGHPQRFFALAA